MDLVTEQAESQQIFAMSEVSKAKLAAQVQKREEGRARVERMGLWRDDDFKRRFAESYTSETEIEPEVSVEEREPLIEVMGLIAAGELNQAVEKLRINATDQSTAAFDFLLGNVLLEQEDSLQALKAYERAVAKFPKFRRAWRMIGEIKTRDADFEAALAALTKVIELNGASGYIYGMLGIGYMNTEKYVSAESSFRTANLLQPDALDWKLGLARSFFGQSKYAAAVSLFDDLIAANPSRADFWLAQGQAYAMQEDYNEAAKNLEIVDQLGKSTAESLNNLGDIYANDKLYDLAVFSYVRAMKKEPSAAPDRAVRAAKFLCSSGGLEQAAILLDGIDKVHTNGLDAKHKKEVLGMRARIALANGADDEQAKILRAITEIDPLDGKALILLGQHAGRKEKEAEAVNYFEQAARIEEFEAEARLRHGELLVRLGKYAEALPLLRSAQALEPRDNVQDYIDRVERAARNSSASGKR